MNEKLATIEKITDIQPIDGADFISSASILGYKSVIKKSDFKIGDMVIFIKPDTLVKRAEWNKFLWPKKDISPDSEPIRIRCCKFKKSISQGLIISINNLEQRDRIEGQGVEEELFITKYIKEIPVQLRGKIKGNFPVYLFPKTDELNILSYPNVLMEFIGKPYYLTVKYDGTSISFYFDNGVFGVCSRNLELLDDDSNVYWKMAKKYDLQEKLTSFNKNLAIQAEIVGPNINGNKVGLFEVQMFVFDIYDLDKKEYYDKFDLQDFCEAMNLERVEVIDSNPSFNYTINELEALAIGYYKNNANLPREGIVLRPLEPIYSPVLEKRLSVKIMNKNFLLKYEE